MKIERMTYFWNDLSLVSNLTNVLKFHSRTEIKNNEIYFGS